MRRSALVIVFTLLALAGLAKGKKSAPTPEELAAITARGRALFDYERAVWNGRAAIESIHAPENRTITFVAIQTPAGWKTGIGALNQEKTAFLLAYEVFPSGAEGKLSIGTLDPPKVDTGAYFLAASAIDTAEKDFQHPARPYNAAVLSADSSRLYVYLYPAVTRKGVLPLGGDVRYLISEDGKKILERRDLHKTILETTKITPSGTTFAGGVHSHILTDIPEDTDVLHVLHNQAPETIGAGGRVYTIAEDGSIRILVK